MEIIGFSNYLIYKDGKVLSKKSNKYLITVKKIMDIMDIV